MQVDMSQLDVHWCILQSAWVPPATLHPFLRIAEHLLSNVEKMDAVLLVEPKRIAGIPIRSYSSHYVWACSSPSAWLPTCRNTTWIAVTLILAMC